LKTSPVNKGRPRATTNTKFEWSRLESGGGRARPAPMGFGKTPGTNKKRTEKLIDEHKEFKKEIRKPR